MKPVPQMVVLVLIFVFGVLGYFAGQNHAQRFTDANDLNKDGEVTLQDFSIALYRVEQIQNELRNQNAPANVIEDVYPPVPLPYQPNN